MWNKIQLIARLTRDPESKNAGGFQIAQFSLAQSQKIGANEKSSFYECKAWNKAAEKAMQYKKGDLIIVEGRIDQESWDAKDGTKRSKHVITVTSSMLIPKGDSLKIDDLSEPYKKQEVVVDSFYEDDKDIF